MAVAFLSLTALRNPTSISTSRIMLITIFPGSVGSDFRYSREKLQNPVQVKTKRRNVIHTYQAGCEEINPVTSRRFSVMSFVSPRRLYCCSSTTFVEGCAPPGSQCDVSPLFPTCI